MLKKIKDALSTKGQVMFKIKVLPKSSRNQIIEGKDLLKIKITIAPEKGKANKALIKFLSKEFKVPQKNIQILNGETSSFKTIQINAL